MRSSLSIPVLAVCAVTNAQQIPFLDQAKSWYTRAASAASSLAHVAASAASTPTIPNPISVGTAALASTQVTRLTLSNFRNTVRPSFSDHSNSPSSGAGIEEWFILITGGNKTCTGQCGLAEEAFNASIPMIVTSATVGNREAGSQEAQYPKFGLLDCESEPVLCHTVGSRPPTVMHVALPRPAADQSTPATTVRYIHLNRTTTTKGDVAALYTERKYEDTKPYEGILHPFDGPLKGGLDVAVGYVLWGWSLLPTWALMLVVSLGSRVFM